MDFYQLNTLTAYRFGESIILPESYVERSLHLGYKGVAIADPNLYAYPSFADACSSTKAIFGCRIALESSLGRPLSAVVYLKDESGYRNLLVLLARKEEEIDLDFLSCIRQGLILVLESDDPALRSPEGLTRLSPEIAKLQKIFKEDFYIGIVISSLLEQNEMEDLYHFAKEREYQTVAFPKVRYLKKSDCASLVLLQKALKKEKAESLPEGGPNFLLSLKSLQEIYRPEDLERTKEIADKCQFVFFQKRGTLIHFDNDSKELFDLCSHGLSERLNTNRVPKEYAERLEYELSVIRKMDYSSYFLLVHDYVQYARRQNIRIGPGRGSAAGSLVSYALFITDVDPILFRLSFERFLNPMRKNMPDIDIDFEDDRRDEIIRYLKVRYGEKRVSDIVTFVRLKPRSAVNLIGPSLSYPQNRLKKLTSVIKDSSTDFRSALTDSYYGKRLENLLQDSYYQDLVDKINPLLGLPVNTSVHAAGVIVSQENLSQSCPLSNGSTGTVLYEYPYMERMGYLKMDILSLSNLTFIRKVEEKIKDKISLLDHLDDKKTFDCLNALELCDIFQLESPGMRKTIKQVHPESFPDLCSILALYRPGPMKYIDEFARRKNGKEQITYLDERLEPILKETYGIIVYQEQVIEIVKTLASFSASQADLFRRAISKKKVEQMEKDKERFLTNCQKNKIPLGTAEKIYEDIEKFAGYGFNKSHAYAYGLISYELLYLKANYPKEFYSTALNETSLGSEECYELMKEIYRHKVTLKGPDINLSDKDEILFRDSSFLLPLSRISQVDKQVLEQIVKEREKGPFLSFYQFCQRMGPLFQGKEERTIDKMIDAGAFDSLSKAREKMKDLFQDYLAFARMSFPEEQVPPLVGEEDLGKRLYLEKQSLGMVLSRSLKSVLSMEGYKTMLVTDDGNVERDHVFTATDGRKDYKIYTLVEGIENNDFLLIQGDFKKTGVLFDMKIVNKKGRKENYGKDIHR